MAQKKKNHIVNDGQANDNSSSGKAQATPATVVLKVDLHCDGCASRITRFLNCFQGVETVTVDGDSGKVTVTGNVDPTKLRDKLAGKTKKKVDLISPQPKKDKDNNKDSDKKKSDDNSEKNNNADNKKPKEPQQSTAVLKVAFHCQGCVERIRKTVSKTRGVKEMSIDKDKETVTVKGSMNVKALVENLKGRLKRNVEVVPPKKDKDKEKEKEKEKEKDGDGEKEGGGGGKKKGGVENKKAEEEGDAGDGGWKLEQNRMNFIPMVPPPYAYGYTYGPVYFMEPVHPPQMFSDENPNACSLM